MTALVCQSNFGDIFVMCGINTRPSKCKITSMGMTHRVARVFEYDLILLLSHRYLHILVFTFKVIRDQIYYSLLAMVAFSAVYSSAQTIIHNAILFIDTSNNASYKQTHWIIETPYLSIIASNDYKISRNRWVSMRTRR